MEDIWAVQERGAEAPSALDQGRQLEPTWRDELPHPQVMGCCVLRHVGVHPGSVWAERVPPPPVHPSHSCLSALRFLQLSGPPKKLALESVLSWAPTRTNMER